VQIFRNRIFTLFLCKSKVLVISNYRGNFSITQDALSAGIGTNTTFGRRVAQELPYTVVNSLCLALCFQTKLVAHVEQATKLRTGYVSLKCVSFSRKHTVQMETFEDLARKKGKKNGLDTVEQ